MNRSTAEGNGSTAKAVLSAMEDVNGQAVPEPKKPGLRKP
jgi:hypothetical protein